MTTTVKLNPGYVYVLAKPTDDGGVRLALKRGDSGNSMWVDLPRDTAVAVIGDLVAALTGTPNTNEEIVL